MATKKAVTAPAIVPKMTVAQAVRDVFIASINKGQFPFAIIGAIAILVIWRMPEHRLGDATQFVLDRLADGAMFGYLLFVITVFGWFFHAQWVRRKTAEQLEAFFEQQRKATLPTKRN